MGARSEVVFWWDITSQDKKSPSRKCPFFGNFSASKISNPKSWHQEFFGDFDQRFFGLKNTKSPARDRGFFRDFFWGFLGILFSDPHLQDFLIKPKMKNPHPQFYAKIRVISLVFGILNICEILYSMTLSRFMFNHLFQKKFHVF